MEIVCDTHINKNIHVSVLCEQVILIIQLMHRNSQDQ